MTPTSSSSLLNRPAPARPVTPMPAPVQRPMMHPGYAMPAQYAPVVVRAQKGSSAAENALMGLLVVLVVAVACVGGYLVARQTAPTPAEMSAYRNIAAQQGFERGRTAGMSEGRAYQVQASREVTRLRALIAKQRRWNAGYRQGRRAGLASARRNQASRPSYGGYRPARNYGGYYRQQRYNATVSGALAAAQSYANATGSAVDVEIYN